jgi:hypothetical protein
MDESRYCRNPVLGSALGFFLFGLNQKRNWITMGESRYCRNPVLVKCSRLLFSLVNVRKGTG